MGTTKISDLNHRRVALLHELMEERDAIDGLIVLLGEDGMVDRTVQALATFSGDRRDYRPAPASAPAVIAAPKAKPRKPQKPAAAGPYAIEAEVEAEKTAETEAKKARRSSGLTNVVISMLLDRPQPTAKVISMVARRLPGASHASIRGALSALVGRGRARRVPPTVPGESSQWMRAS